MLEFNIGLGDPVLSPAYPEETVMLTPLQRLGRIMEHRAAVFGPHIAALRLEETGDEATVVFATPGVNFMPLMRLIRELQQDCVAVYDSDNGRGELVGPNAAAWGDFDLAAFRRA